MLICSYALFFTQRNMNYWKIEQGGEFGFGLLQVIILPSKKSVISDLSLSTKSTKTVLTLELSQCSKWGFTVAV